MENNLTNKEIFFGQYLYQTVLLWPGGEVTKVSDAALYNADQCCLQLRNIEHLDENDLYNLISNKYLGEVQLKDLIIHKTWIQYRIKYSPKGRWTNKSLYLNYLNTWQSDYLRAEGFAIPFRGVSVDQLIEYGWLRLTPNTK